MSIYSGNPYVCDAKPLRGSKPVYFFGDECVVEFDTALSKGKVEEAFMIAQCYIREVEATLNDRKISLHELNFMDRQVLMHLEYELSELKKKM